MGMPVPRPVSDRERFLAFAFAAAELLVELGPDGRIAFAAGAFRQRLGRDPEEWVGRAPAEILAPEDRDAFAASLALMRERGRMPPTAFHLSDGVRTDFAVGGLLLPQGAESRFCLTFAPLPHGSALPPTRVAPGTLTRAAEQRLREGERAGLALIEVNGVPQEAGEALRAALFAEGTDSPAPELPAGLSLEGIAALRQALAREREGGLVAPLAPGRFGIMHAPGHPPDLGAIARGLDSALGGTSDVSVRLAAQLDLAPGMLSPVQAARALRHGLSLFARLGAEGLRAAGFADGLEGLVSRIVTRAGALRMAVTERRFRLDFQPIAELSSRRIHHYEALLRPSPEVLQPGENPQDFATLAETVGLTEELDLAVAAVALAATPAAPAGRRLAFNISGLSAQSATFRARLLALLERDRRAASRVMVELTESAEIEDQAAAAETLALLRARDVPVCLDDFGAGAAAFHYLRAFPVDHVKVDGSYVRAALTIARDRSFVQAMVDLSQAVGASVVAEHIETEDCAVLMASLGVRYGQGWLFGKAGPL